MATRVSYSRGFLDERSVTKSDTSDHCLTINLKPGRISMEAGE